MILLHLIHMISVYDQSFCVTRHTHVNAHRGNEDDTLQYGESKSTNKDMKNHSCLNHSKQKTEIIKAHVLHPKFSFLHMIRERDV
jgi:hypothetical protein